MPDRMLGEAQHAQILVALLDVRPNLRVISNILKRNHAVFPPFSP